MTKKISDYDWEIIKWKLKTKEYSVPEIAKEYKVTKQHIYLKLRQEANKSWLKKLNDWLNYSLFK